MENIKSQVFLSFLFIIFLILITSMLGYCWNSYKNQTPFLSYLVLCMPHNLRARNGSSHSCCRRQRGALFVEDLKHQNLSKVSLLFIVSIKVNNESNKIFLPLGKMFLLLCKHYCHTSSEISQNQCT